MAVEGGSGSYTTTVDTPGVLNMSAGDTSPIVVSLGVWGIYSGRGGSQFFEQIVLNYGQVPRLGEGVSRSASIK